MSDIHLQLQKPASFTAYCINCPDKIYNVEYIRLYSSDKTKEEWNFHIACFKIFVAGMLKFYDIFITNPTNPEYLS